MSLSYGLDRLQPQHNPFQIVLEGLSEYPSNHNYQLEGDAVGMFARYPFNLVRLRLWHQATQSLIQQLSLGLELHHGPCR